jgi:regulator of sirC expression with transglutaminase-like and TPR domain
VFWVRRYILFHNKRHPSELGKSDLEKFLNFLASTRHVSASTQSQALSALIFMYRDLEFAPVGAFEQNPTGNRFLLFGGTPAVGVVGRSL